MTLFEKARLMLAAILVVAAACESTDTGVEPENPSANFAKYVAIGTSISMGVASDGAVAASQQNAWPKLLANDIGVTFNVPLIDAPGCRPPFGNAGPT